MSLVYKASGESYCGTNEYIRKMKQSNVEKLSQVCKYPGISVKDLLTET